MNDQVNLLEMNDPQSFDENKDWLNELVGENKKFKSTTDLAKGKAQSDNYIKILEARMDAMREDYLKVREENVAGEKLQDRIAKLEQLEQQLASRNNTPQSNEVQPKPELDLTQLESILDQREQSKQQIENAKRVMSKLEERFGESYKTVLRQEATKLGMSDEDVNSMAKNNPTLFEHTFGLDTQPKVQQFQTPPRSQVRQDNFAPSSGAKRTMTYYNELRKSNPLAWYDPKIAVQMDKDSQLLGAAFYDA